METIEKLSAPGTGMLNESGAVKNGMLLRDSSKVPGDLSITDDKHIKLRAACTQFEQVFLKYMVDRMWSSVEAVKGEQTAEKAIWQDFFNNEMAKVLAENSITGISANLYEQLKDTLPTVGTEITIQEESQET